MKQRTGSTVNTTHGDEKDTNIHMELQGTAQRTE